MIGGQSVLEFSDQLNFEDARAAIGGMTDNNNVDNTIKPTNVMSKLSCIRDNI